MSDRLLIDITPDKSLIKKLGLTGYRTEQAIAELVDNSIDARIQGQKEVIKVKLDFEKREMEVSDDGTGMDKKEIQDAMTIAKGTKSGEKLGRFGIGMKSACSTLGKEFTIITAKSDSDKEYIAKYDEERWLSDESVGWQNFEIIEGKKEQDWHGTRIKISKLNVPLYPNQVSNFRESFNIRYAPYLLQNQVEIQINTTYCTPEEPEIEKGTRREIDIELPSGARIRGWIGLLRKRSIKGNYGIHLFKNGRLIKAFAKFGFRAHPELAKIIGRLDLDHVPVNFHKSAFIEDSIEYREAEKAFQESTIVKEIAKEAMKRMEVIPAVTDVLGYISGKSEASYLDTRISADTARQLIERQEKTEIEIKDHHISFLFVVDETSPLYTIKKTGPREFQVRINKKDEAFKFFKNPLHLLGIIGIEAKLIAEDPEIYERFVSKRNTQWQEFAADWSKKGVEKRTREITTPNLPNYSLASDLVALHDVLKEEFEGRIQFTALSTLVPFLHNILGKMVYTLYTEPGMGEKLVQLLSYVLEDKVVVLRDPSPKELEVAMDVSQKNRFIVVREYAQIYGPTFAEPEEAWIDLLVEIRKNKIPVAENELKYILQELTRKNLVTRDRLVMLAKRRKQLEVALPIIEEVL
jgi:hypothetical protein